MDCSGSRNLNECATFGNSKGSEWFIDRSKVRILLCDCNAKSSDEVCTLLLKCGYQVTSVRSARQVIDALNSEGPDIDIILAEVDLPMAKGFKMLKHIARDKNLQRIPVIMMSSKDEVSVVVKCLRLGAADYLVKPLRTNELLNLWTHMWRRRHMLGLAEKNILNYGFDLVPSELSDANTNSTTLLSDDTDDKSRRNNIPETGFETHQEHEIAAAPASFEPMCTGFMETQLDMPVVSICQKEQVLSVPKKSELKIGESSAFLTYKKSSMPDLYPQKVSENRENTHQNSKKKVVMHECSRQVQETSSQREDFSGSASIPDFLSTERSCTPPMSREFSQDNCNEGNFHQNVAHSGNEPQFENSGSFSNVVYPYYMPHLVNQVMMPLSGQPNHLTSTMMMPHYGQLPQCPPPHAMSSFTSFPYYHPVSTCLQQNQMSTNTHPWPILGSSDSTLVKKVNGVDRRREAALIKFRQKRKERCFVKKIRYVNRKQLAERRPRVRGQFVSKVNGVNVDLNGEPASADYDEADEDGENASRDSYPEDDA